MWVQFQLFQYYMFVFSSVNPNNDYESLFTTSYLLYSYEKKIQLTEAVEEGEQKKMKHIRNRDKQRRIEC